MMVPVLDLDQPTVFIDMDNTLVYRDLDTTDIPGGVSLGEGEDVVFARPSARPFLGALAGAARPLLYQLALLSKGRTAQKQKTMIGCGLGSIFDGRLYGTYDSPNLMVSPRQWVLVDDSDPNEPEDRKDIKRKFRWLGAAWQDEAEFDAILQAHYIQCIAWFSAELKNEQQPDPYPLVHLIPAIEAKLAVGRSTLILPQAGTDFHASTTCVLCGEDCGLVKPRVDGTYSCKRCKINLNVKRAAGYGNAAALFLLHRGIYIDLDASDMTAIYDAWNAVTNWNDRGGELAPDQSRLMIADGHLFYLSATGNTFGRLTEEWLEVYDTSLTDEHLRQLREECGTVLWQSGYHRRLDNFLTKPLGDPSGKKRHKRAGEGTLVAQLPRFRSEKTEPDKPAGFSQTVFNQLRPQG